ncbi:MAG: hypothetical protein K2L96_05630 [Muribaculaceae bacterium]|nr:hypothetical protein [Muribaculaceae bacterium]
MNKLFTLFALALASLAPAASSAETLTLCDGTAKNDGAPVYAYWMDRANRSQLIYPASMLEDLKGKTLTGFKFFIATPATRDWTNPDMNISLATVSETNFGVGGDNSTLAYNDATAQTVFSGEVNVATTAAEWTIEFTTPYTYEGGNLLVDFTNPAKGTAPKIYWTGENQSENTAIAKANGLRGIPFLPKVEISYTADLVGALASVSVKSLSYPLTFTDDSSEKSVIVYNVGSEPVTGIVKIEGSGYFSTDVNTIEIPVGESYELDVMYSPKATGDDAATMTIDMGEAGVFEVALEGTALDVPSDYRMVFNAPSYDQTLPAGWTPYAVELFAADNSISDTTADYAFFPSYYHFGTYSVDGSTGMCWNHVNPAANTDLYWQYFYIVSPELEGKMMLRAAFTDLPATGAFIKVYPVESYDSDNRRFTFADEALDIEWDTPLDNKSWSVANVQLPGKARYGFFMKYAALNIVAADFSVSGVEVPAIVEAAPAEGETLVFDLAGRSISAEAYKSGNLPRGVYIVRNGDKAFKIIK